MKAPSPHTGTPRKVAVDTAPEVPEAAEPGSEFAMNTLTSRHSLHALLPAWLCSARTFPHLPPFPSRMQERAVQQLGTYCKWHHLLFTLQLLCRLGHRDIWEQGLGHLLLVSCQEARAGAPQQSPELAVVVPASGPGQETAAWAGEGAGLQLYVTRTPRFHNCPSS